MIITVNNKKVLVDDEDYQKLYPGSFFINNRGYVIFSKYNKQTQKSDKVRLHRFLINVDDQQYVDHINGDKLDNRKQNLRTATQSQNIANSKKSRANTSGYKGVTWSKQHKKWIAQMTQNSKHIHLGLFDCPSKASEAYDHAVMERFGVYAKPNSDLLVAT